MARPTVNFTGDTLITADGDYIFEVPTNVPHSFVAKGIFGGGTLTLTAYDPKLDAGGVAIDGGSWTAPFEDGFTSPFSILTLTMTGATGAGVSVNWAPIKQHVHDT